MTLSNTLSWYIVQFKPNSHKISVRNLQRQEFETFLPMHEVTRRTEDFYLAFRRLKRAKPNRPHQAKGVNYELLIEMIDANRGR